MRLNNMKELRERHGLSMDAIAEKGGVSKATVHDTEIEKTIPSQITMMKIGKGFGLPTEAVFNLDWDTDMEGYM